jgi:hypothetical protein
VTRTDQRGATSRAGPLLALVGLLALALLWRLASQGERAPRSTGPAPLEALPAAEPPANAPLVPAERAPLAASESAPAPPAAPARLPAPGWRCQGTLVDGHGAGVEGLLLTLEPAQGAPVETRTLPGGGFSLPLVTAGEYVLVVGDPLGPLVPRRPVRVDEHLAPLELEVPVLLELDVRVLDDAGLPVAGARVEGIGESGGRVAGETDAEGRLRARELPPGNYRLFARHDELGRANRAFTLAEGERTELELRLLTEPPPR